jgi:PAS domain S-box-containing protein
MGRGDGFNASLSDDGRYRLLVDAVTDYAIYMLDPEGRVASWNAGAQRFKGYLPAEIIGQHFSRFYSEEDRRAGVPQRALQTALHEGRFESEGWRIRKDGSRFWAYVVIDPIRHPATGALVGFAKVTRDLTERKLTEAALKRSEQQFRLLVQGVTDYAIYMLDTTGRVTSWNPGARRIKGYLPEEIIGEHFSRFYTEEDRAQAAPERGLITARRAGRFENEGWRIRKDGSRFWAHVVIDAVRDEMGEIIGFAKITRDITERRQAQRALQEAQEALFQLQKMEAIGRLTGGIAHDFNNLLMAVLGSLEMLRKRLPDDPKITSLLDSAVQGAERGATLTQRMLAFARRQNLNSKAVDLPALVHGMAGLLQQSLGPSVRIETRFPPTLDPIHADANQLESALLNLAVNARDAMPDGGSLSIGARQERFAPGHNNFAAGDYVCLTVTDTGHGMDAETLARAIEPFFTTKGVGKGTGLGLSMVHGMAEQSGGHFLLKSRKGEGTTAEIWLPVSKHSPQACGRAVEQSIDDSSADKRSMVVLAVDDDALVLRNTTDMLEELGYTVLGATSGEHAIEVLSQAREVHLVISDHAMPDMTGTQLAEAIRTERPDLPIIIVTGFAELPPHSGMALPMLAKPFRMRDLQQAITDVLKLA